jgi:DNA-binding NarL/FixJ family response regulator
MARANRQRRSLDPLIPAELWPQVVESLALSPQQAKLVALLLTGMRNKEIAAAMNLAEPTLKTYLNRIFRRLGVRDRIQLVVYVCSVAMELSRSGRPCGCHPDGRHPK